MCSGCAGDYEDPDQSAWEEEEGEGVEEVKETEHRNKAMSPRGDEGKK